MIQCNNASYTIGKRPMLDGSKNNEKHEGRARRQHGRRERGDMKKGALQAKKTDRSRNNFFIQEKKDLKTRNSKTNRKGMTMILIFYYNKMFHKFHFLA